MEMQFDKNPVAYLQKLTGQLRTQEQTLEVRLPDGMPDIGRVLGAWGQVIVRGKEWNGDHMAVSCGVMAWVLYTPEDGEGVRSVEAWLPFSMKWDLPDTRHDGKIMTSCLLKGVDARSTSARKLMVRATISALGEAWLPGQAEYAVPASVPEDVEMLTATYPLMLPKEAGEKPFALEEQINLPAGPKLEKILHYCLQPEILDKKIMAGKVVFRGSAALHMLYRADDEKLYTYDCDLPFSQFAELEGEYDRDPTVAVWPCVTGVDLEPDEEGALQLKAGLLGQYLLCDRELVTVTEDAYSPRRAVTPIYEELQLPAVLDQTSQNVSADVSQEADVQQVVDVAFYPSYAPVESTPTGMRVALPGQFQMLYYDSEGELRGMTVPWEGEWNWDMERDSMAHICLTSSGKPQANPGAGTVALRGEMLLNAVAGAGQGIRMITGLEMGDMEKADPNRPSLILCRKGGRRLWDVAKETGTTVSQIMQANHLESEPGDNAVLLIPVI